VCGINPAAASRRSRWRCSSAVLFLRR